MKTSKLLFYIFLCLFSIITPTFSQNNFIKTIPSTENGFLKEVREIKGTFVTFRIGGMPIVYFFDKIGNLTKEIDLSSSINNIYSLEVIGDKIFLGGSILTNQFQQQAKLLVIDINGSITFRREYSLAYISAIKLIGESIYLGGNGGALGSKSKSKLIVINKSGDFLKSFEYGFVSNSHISEVLELNNKVFIIAYASTVGVGFEGFNIAEISKTDGSIIKINKVQTGYFKEYINRDLFIPIDATIQGNNILVVCSSEGYGTGSGLFSFNDTLMLENQVNLLNYSISQHPFSVKATNDKIYMTGISVDGDSIKGFLQIRDNKGNIILNKNINNNIIHDFVIVEDNIYGVGSLNSYLQNGLFKPLYLKMNSEGKLYDSKTKIIVNLKNECSNLSHESFNEAIYLTIDSERYEIHDKDTLIIDKPIGKYPLEIKTPIKYNVCNLLNEIDVDTLDSIVEISVTEKMCTDLIPGITATELIRGVKNKLYLNCTNRGSKAADNVSILFTSNTKLNQISSAYSFTKISDFEVKFELGKIRAEERVIIPIELYIDKDKELYSTINFYSLVNTSESCNEQFNSYDGSNIEINPSCNNGTAEFSIINTGSNMKKSTSYSVFVDGYLISTSNLILKKNETLVEKIKADGKNITLSVQQEKENVFSENIDYSMEGCGAFNNAYFSKGVGTYYNDNKVNLSNSRCQLEVKDNIGENRIIEIQKGIGYYHYKNEFSSREFSLRYVNNDNENTTVINFEILLSKNFKLETFAITALSHPSDYTILNDRIVVKVTNINLKKLEEYHLRFWIDSKVINGNLTLEICNATAIVNNKNTISFNAAYNNIKSSLDYKSQSPFSNISPGNILGKHSAIDFFGDMCIFNDDSKIVSSTMLEGGQGYITSLYFIDPYDKILNEKSYNFSQGGSVFNYLVKISEDNILLFGRIEDKNNPINYTGFSYTAIICIDRKGNKKWEKIWKFDEKINRSGEIFYVHRLDNNNIAFAGSAITVDGYREFYAFTDTLGNVSDIKYLNFNSEMAFIPGQEKLLIIDAYYSGNTHDQKYILLDKKGTIIDEGVYAYDYFDYALSNNYSKFINDKIYLTGNIYDRTLKDHFSTLIIFDLTKNEKKIIHILKDEYYFSPVSFLKQSDGYLFTGEYLKDSLPDTKLDLLLVKTDSLGNEIWRQIYDAGSRAYANKLIESNNKYYIGFQTQASDDIYNLQLGYFIFNGSKVNVLDDSSKNNSKMSIFPNPTSDYINFSEDLGIAHYKIIDLAGKAIYQSNNLNNVIYVNSLPTGNYFLLLIDKNGLKYIKSFSKI